MFKKTCKVLLASFLILSLAPGDVENANAKQKATTVHLKESTLNDQIIKGDLIITAAAGKNISLKNVRVLGTTYVKGKAPETIALTDSSLKTLSVLTPSHSTTITAAGKTIVRETLLDADASLMEKTMESEGFQNVTVYSSSSKKGKVSMHGDFETISTAADGKNKSKEAAVELVGISQKVILNTLSNLSLTEDTIIKELIVTSGGRESSLNGNGSIEAATLKSPIIFNGKMTKEPSSFVTPWSLIWNDEFNGKKIDRTKWTFDLGNGYTDGNGEFVSGWGNNEKQYYTDREENARTEDGKLLITAKEEEYEGFSYTSSRLKTKGLFAKTYGKFEMKASLPAGKGYWPAFWMLPEDDIYGGWAASGEIDILEAKGSKPHEAIGTIHYGESWPNNKYTGTEYQFEDGTTIEDEHVYAVEWEPGEIRWYVDGKLYQTQNNWYSKGKNAAANHTYPAPFDQPFHLLLNLAIGGNFDGEPTDETMFPQSMDVEYVRVYDLTGRPYQTPELPTIEVEPMPDEAKQPLDDGNLVYNNGFDQEWNDVEGIQGVPNTDYWYFLTLPDFGGKAAISIDQLNSQSFAKVDIENGGNQPYAVQLIQDVSIGKGRYYKVTFDAKSTNTRSINTKVSGGAERGFVTYSQSESFSLTDQLQTYEMVFQMSEKTDLAARLEFNLGLSTDPVWIGNVRVEETSPPDINPDASKPPLPDGNLVYNGTFDQGFPDRLLYWNIIDPANAGSVEVDPDQRNLTATVSKKSAPEDVQLLQKGIQLEQGQDYELSLDAKAEKNREIQIELRSQDGKVTYAKNTQSLSADWSAETFSFTMPEITDLDAQLIINLGGSTHKVTLDSIQLKKKIDFNPLPIQNGQFDNGLTNWESYIHFDAAATIQHDDGQALIRIDNEGKEPWSVQFFQNDLILEPNKKYTLSFDIQSTKDRAIEVTLENNQYTRFLSETIELNNNTTRHEFSFSVPSNEQTSLKFLLGSSNAPIGVHDIRIDNVELKQ